MSLVHLQDVYIVCRGRGRGRVGGHDLGKVTGKGHRRCLADLLSLFSQFFNVVFFFRCFCRISQRGSEIKKEEESKNKEGQGKLFSVY